jgi:NADPH-dependent 2,4-dienoyl-CoA reductase/sulfur reductase-like enzyme/peroxiredoxin family protein/rhodanese-related sulfurtransferase/TusA-related sulfurtransferase
MARVLIVGGVAGGATTAARLRRMDENAEIVLFERGDYISYANCGLPYYVGGAISERDRLFVQTPQGFSRRFKVDVRTGSAAARILPAEKRLEVKDLKSGKTYTERYDKLVLSPGAEPIKPPIPGISLEGVFTIRNVPDTDRIKEYIEKNSPRRALIVGAGFIGLEMAENLHALGMMVTIVEMAEQVMTPLDYEMAAEVHQHLKTKNVEFYLRESVTALERDDRPRGILARLSSGRAIPVDMVILSIGIRPESSLAREAGLEIGEKGGIVVNEHLQTSDPDIYALGDAVVYKSPLTGRPLLTYLAGPANKQGRIVADNIVLGNVKRYAGALSTAIAKVFDLTVASTGVSEKTLKTEGIPYLSSITHSVSHAGYYPGSLPMSVKIVFSPDDGKLYGAQIVGYEGVDKRIDVIAAVLRHGGTVYDLQEIEHAYAPPYSSAKDPVNVAGFVAENILKGYVKTISWSDLPPHTRGRDGAGSDGRFLLDVRQPEEYALGTVEGSVNIPLGALRERLGEIPRDVPIVTICGVGLRAYIGARILAQNGFGEVYNLSGGYKTWEHVTRKQSNEDIFEKDVIGKDDNIYQAAVEKEETSMPVRIVDVDASGLQCPGPIVRLKQEIDRVLPGERIRETATDPGFRRDVGAWCSMTGHRLVSLGEAGGKITAVVEKTDELSRPPTPVTQRNATIVVFSDDFDRALASFVIANGAASAGKKVTMFFTFWGLNILKKSRKPGVKKDFMGKMFGMMLPGSTRALKLSKLNMMGMGAFMMRKRMSNLRIDSLEEMIASAVKSGVELIACQMSMDVMGVHREELIDEARVGGVATYLGEAEKGGVNLFV